MRAPIPVLVASVFLAGLPATRAQEKLGRLIVKVTEAETGKPVARAIANFSSGALDLIDERERMTDANGRVEIALPLGELRLRPPSPPAGYWMPHENVSRQGFEPVVLTREQPTIERSYEATRAVRWPARVVTRGGKPAEGVRLHPSFNSGRGGHGGTSQTDASGFCQLTFPRGGGELWVSCNGGTKFAVDFTASRVELAIAPDFDPAQVASRQPAAEGDRIVLIDRAGRRASLAGCGAVLREGAVELTFEVNIAGPEHLGELVGRIVDTAGQPIADATVICNHNAMVREEYSKRSAADGSFRFRGPLKWSRSSEEPAFLLMVDKDGYVHHEESHIFATGEDGVFRLEPIVLKPGYAVAVQVLNEDGQPADGARLFCNVGERIWPRPDRQGLATMKNLPIGEVTISAQYGGQSGSVKIDVTPATAAADPVVIRLRKGAAQGFARVVPRLPPAVRLELGRPAPAWSVAQWNDGKEHTLAELRGRVVVIQFWEVGGHGVREISLPVSEVLQKRFPEVAFVHIHPSGARQHFVKELLDLYKWSFLVGFDKLQGAGGETQQRYGSIGDSTVILDREGKVVMNSELRGDRAAEEAKMKTINAAAGLPWPIQKDASQDELIRRNRRFHEQWIGAEIEKALEK